MKNLVIQLLNELSLEYEEVPYGIFLYDFETILVLNRKFYEVNDPIDEIRYVDLIKKHDDEDEEKYYDDLYNFEHDIFPDNE